MARFDLFDFNGGIVVDLQADIIVIPGSRVVAPLIKAANAPPSTKALHPQVMIDAVPYVIVTHLLAATPEAALKDPIGSLAAYADEITQALDVLFQGL